MLRALTAGLQTTSSMIVTQLTVTRMSTLLQELAAANTSLRTTASMQTKQLSLTSTSSLHQELMAANTRILTAYPMMASAIEAPRLINGRKKAILTPPILGPKMKWTIQSQQQPSLLLAVPRPPRHKPQGFGSHQGPPQTPGKGRERECQSWALRTPRSAPSTPQPLHLGTRVRYPPP